ncbi:MAG: ergothioneine biosynthesis protein EgtB [Acidimicrobiales bacterium]|nr:ergothioneine biosynthesis protein EgtB [Acidimicrobiales bacterium]
MALTAPAIADDRSPAVGALETTRTLTEWLAAPLAPEDQVVQSMPDVSPTKWHRAHTTWFFETFVLGPHDPGYEPVHPGYDYLFNSYYEQVGPRYPRPDRGLISRPTCAEVGAYREAVDRSLAELLDGADDATWRAVAPLVELGVHHEQQHQELLLMDIKHVFSVNPLRPAYAHRAPHAAGEHRWPTSDAGRGSDRRWVDVDVDGIVEVGHDGRGFAFDNEGPRHQALVRPFRLADRLVTVGDWSDFMADGGYDRPELWLSEGWATVQQQGWRAPLYWESDGPHWAIFTLEGLGPLVPDAPVCHVSFFEADAFARWSGARLPTEEEWEVAAVACPAADRPNDLSSGALHPRAAPAAAGPGLRQLGGDVWEWTASPYRPYPGFHPLAGAIGEYNGKFMCNQMVLRGGSCATPAGHTRPTYRNFFPPSARWAFSGLRLAADD